MRCSPSLIRTRTAKSAIRSRFIYLFYSICLFIIYILNISFLILNYRCLFIKGRCNEICDLSGHITDIKGLKFGISISGDN